MTSKKFWHHFDRSVKIQMSKMKKRKNPDNEMLTKKDEINVRNTFFLKKEKKKVNIGPITNPLTKWLMPKVKFKF